MSHKQTQNFDKEKAYAAS